MPHDALAHLLRPGATLDFTVDAGRRVRRATRDVGGVSFHQETGEGTYEWPPEMDPKNPMGVERDRPLPGASERKVAGGVFFSGGRGTGRPSSTTPISASTR